MTQHAVIVKTGPNGHSGLETLNVKLERGWQVAKITAMGGAETDADAPTHAALVILKRRDSDRPTPAAAVAALEKIGEESEEVVEQVVEEAEDVVDGNGTPPPISIRPEPPLRFVLPKCCHPPMYRWKWPPS